MDRRIAGLIVWFLFLHFRGLLHDTVLDWEASLPEHDLDRADGFSR